MSIAVWQLLRWRAGGHGISSLAFCADGSLLLAGLINGALGLWSVSGGLVGRFGEHTWELADRGTWVTTEVCEVLEIADSLLEHRVVEPPLLELQWPMRPVSARVGRTCLWCSQQMRTPAGHQHQQQTAERTTWLMLEWSALMRLHSCFALKLELHAAHHPYTLSKYAFWFPVLDWKNDAQRRKSCPQSQKCCWWNTVRH